MYFSTAQEMERLDLLAVDFGLDISQMMELAGWHMVSLFREKNIPKNKKIAVIVGKGNKGGDGLSAVRHLYNQGYYNIFIVLIDRNIKLDPLHHLNLLNNMNIPIYSFDEQSKEDLIDSDIVIDSLLGYHINGAPRGLYNDIIDFISGLDNKQIVSYDIPSGIDATTGECLGACIKANMTLTLALPKQIFQTDNGQKYSGEVWLVDIGIPSFLYNQISQNSRPNFSAKGIIKIL